MPLQAGLSLPIGENAVWACGFAVRSSPDVPIMLSRFKRLLPTRVSLQSYRSLRWLLPWLNHPRLWHMSRKGIAVGLALGIFFGLLIPIAQIPFAATSAVLLRAHIPTAVASTLVTNPVTFAPVYFGAYQLGKWILRHDQASPEELQTILERKTQQQEQRDQMSLGQRIGLGWQNLSKIGKPLILGLSIVATSAGLAAYFLVHFLWIWRVRWERRRRIYKMRHPD